MHATDHNRARSFRPTDNIGPGACVTRFQALGGDGYPKLTSHQSFMDSGFVDADVLRAFIMASSPIKAADFQPGDAVVRR